MKENESKDILSHYRILSLLGILISMLVLTSFLCFWEHLLIDFWVCGYAISLLFFAAIFFQLEFERKRARISDNVETTFLRIAVGFGCCTVLTAGFLFIPAFYRPFILFPVFMYSLCNGAISISISVYFPVMLCFVTNGSIYELSLYILWIIVAVVWVRALDDDKYHVLVSLILSLITIFSPVLYEYMNIRKLYMSHGIFSAIDGVVVFLLCFFAYRKIRHETVVEVANRLEDILSDDYSAVIELKNYSRIEFSHALLVSKLCFKYAKRLNLRADLCAAAGFYYRMGKWKGEPHVENGVTYAKQLCFPTEMIVIISEYYGEEALPSSAESALVHIIDASIKKLQALKDSAAASTWNREMLIYQTLNEFSQSGIYDKSGLTMNQFLKIRDMLVKEELLNEFLS